MVSDIKQQMANDVSQKQQCGTDIEANEASSREDREEENLNFVKEVSEQRDMLSVLTKAFTVLKNHYEKATLVQIKEHTISKESSLIRQTPMPVEFTPFKHNSGGNAVLSMFEKIMREC